MGIQIWYAYGAVSGHQQMDQGRALITALRKIKKFFIRKIKKFFIRKIITKAHL
jgi:hypothetical protein